MLGLVGFNEPLVAISRKRKIMKIMTVGDPMRTCGLSRFQDKKYIDCVSRGFPPLQKDLINMSVEQIRMNPNFFFFFWKAFNWQCPPIVVFQVLSICILPSAKL